VRIRFLGADRQVTGSKHLLESGPVKALVDCGLYQERPYLDRNWDSFPVSPGTIDVIFLTHAHLDHCGYIPKLVKDGFAGRILATPATAELAEIVLLDAANIQEEDAAFKKKRHAREGRRGPHPEIPLYTVDDVALAMTHFTPVSYDDPVEVDAGVVVRFREAGHILGSAMVAVDTRNGGPPRRLIFSGDIGPWEKPIIHEPALFEAADYVVMESTYANRNHEDAGRIEERLAGIINQTAARGGNVVVPVFALERAQELLFYLGRLVRSGMIPRLPVFLDSPMAAEVTAIFARYPSLLDPEAEELVRSGVQPFDFPGLRLVRSIEESKAINALKTPCIILAGSGMCTAGRVKHHLTRNISRPESTVLFVGYQANHTLGRQILDRRPSVRIFGQAYEVRAEVERIQAFSGHAGQSDLLRWLRAFKTPPRRLFLVHGEEEVSLDLARFLEGDGWSVSVPVYDEAFELD
jgi:metallo-beta-lactamase family protein